MIRKVQLNDAARIAEIYNYYILHTIVTFEEEVLSGEEMEARLKEHNTELPWLVYEEEGQVMGYAYAVNWRARAAYRNSVEISIYLDHRHRGKGVGSVLYKDLIERLIEMEFHVIIGGVSLPNPASEKLHEKLGFKKVAHFKEVGYKLNQWVDVGFWEILVEGSKKPFIKNRLTKAELSCLFE